jgi:2-keto-4-pentenoate hydratase/2-oxohepta-3-ene-1,7-dioic acid hydratase in catechol pathway
MKLARLATPAGPAWASCRGDAFYEVSWIEGKPHDTGVAIPRAKLLAPVEPPVILAIGQNYSKHAEETGARPTQFPVVFVKTPNTLCNPGEDILIPRKLRSDKVDFEGELAFVISKIAKNVPRELAANYILGLTIANDISARDWQKEWGGSQWIKGKSFDTFCPIGPYVLSLDEFEHWRHLRLTTRVNGEILQDAYTDEVIYDIPALVEFLSGSTTLLPGTVVLTGTPEGVGMARTPPRWLQPGDSVEVEIEGIGVLANQMVEEAVTA